MDSTTARRPCFVEDDDGLASLADMEPGFSGKHHHHHHLLSRPVYYSAASPRKSSSLSLSSPRCSRFYGGGSYEDHQPHFLDYCFLCKTPIGDNRDIFMYRGDTPFCSEECRQEQIEMDEANEKNMKLSMKALRKKDHKKSSSPNKNTQDYPFHTGAVIAA